MLLTSLRDLMFQVQEQSHESLGTQASEILEVGQNISKACILVCYSDDLPKILVPAVNVRNGTVSVRGREEASGFMIYFIKTRNMVRYVTQFVDKITNFILNKIYYSLVVDYLF